MFNHHDGPFAFTPGWENIARVVFSEPGDYVLMNELARCRVWEVCALAEKASIELDDFFVVGVIKSCVFDLGEVFAFTKSP